MCGRKFSHEELTWAEYRDILAIVQPPPASNFQPNYNICPTQRVPVCVNRAGTRSLEPMHWGLVPHWAKDRKFAANMINARAETLTEKPSFKPLLDENRCIIMVSGFYEWQRAGQTKTPYKVERSDRQPMLLAGLWTHNDRLDIDSYAVITTAAPPAFAPIHDRAPAILEQTDIDAWMDGSWNEAEKLAKPFRNGLQTTRVSSRVNSNRNNDPQLIEPIAE
ncbi:SOS response-associated peptidase [Sphingorhabdus sp. SMR4y]|uniref:SOS response-associated peptidase n=1 Tax=Sphingorhabdus sp. SMR4y TaxID=2584094 RepID=UPI000B5CB7C9|nr:SOS response-associated peptidase [Sphingorhabdus sp. SMR4y]ASK87321.1 putative SOS response-associated peptidase YedK [Sphingorhabdus sp. SMR4y]